MGFAWRIRLRTIQKTITESDFGEKCELSPAAVENTRIREDNPQQNPLHGLSMAVNATESITLRAQDPTALQSKSGLGSPSPRTLRAADLMHREDSDPDLESGLRSPSPSENKRAPTSFSASPASSIGRPAQPKEAPACPKQLGSSGEAPKQFCLCMKSFKHTGRKCKYFEC